MWKSYKIHEKIRIDEMYSLFEVHFDKGYSFPGETHDFWECLYVIKGKVRVLGDERIYNLKDNEIIFHKPLELHKFNVESENGADLLIFSFSACGELIDFFKNKVFKLSLEQISVINNFLDFLHEKSGALYFDSKDITTKILSNFEKFQFFSHHVVVYLYQLFLSLYDYNTMTTASEDPDALVFSDAVSYMKENIGNQLPIEKIALYCRKSSTGIKKIFKNYSGLSIHKYFLKLKMTEAARLLKNGMSVTEISDYLGFSDQSYFSYAFSRETGMTPGDYKKMLNNAHV